MSLAINQNLAAATVTYNGVQFGGADSLHQSLPPQYSFRSVFVYDESGRAVEYTRYILNVSAVFYASSEAAMATLMDSLKLKLAQPGKVLKIEGLGTGFGTITYDDEWGPHPIECDFQPLGQIAWQLNYSIAFSLKECDSEGHASKLTYTAFNFDTTWMNNFEGICERTITGHVKIVGKRIATTSNIPAAVADEVRNTLTVVCPQGFRRVRNVWKEGSVKNRLDFVVTDEVLPGTVYPAFCSYAAGSTSYASQGPGFAKALVTMDMSIRVAPGVSPAVGGIIFLTAAATKYKDMLTGIGDGTCIPKSISIVNGKFDQARETHASMTWMLTKCTKDMMKAAGIWEPISSTNYQQWRTSIEHLWDNRGALLVNGNTIRSEASDSVIIDLCNGVTETRIADTGINEKYPKKDVPFNFTCPEIPKDGGWLIQELKVRILRDNPQSWHRKSVSYLPTPGYISGAGSALADSISLGGHPYEVSPNEEADIEHHGKPIVYILLQYRALRVKHKPNLPEIKSIGGLPVVEVKSDVDGPNPAFDAINCPVWMLRGYRVYRINGYVPTVKATKDKSSCASAPKDDQTEY